MEFQVSTIVIDADAENRQELAQFLTNHGIQVFGQFASAEQVATLLGRQDSPQLVIVNLDPSPRETLKKVGHLPRQFPSTSFMLMSQVVEANLLMEAMHLGVREFVPLPISEDKFAAAIERVSHIHGLGRKAKIMQVIPSIGGCGSTTIACNVAASLARTHKTVLIDLDLVRGGVASYFDIRPRFTLADVMDADKLDKQLLDNALTIHPGSKLAVLARPEQPEDTQRVTQAGLSRLLNLLARLFDYVVIDSLMSVDPVYAGVIQACDVSVIVMQLNVPSVKNAERFVGTLRRMGIDQEKLRIVANRFIKKAWDIEPAEVEKTLGLKISWMVPNDFKTAIAAINFGEPFVLRAPKTEISTSLTGLAAMLGAPTATATRSAA